MRLAQPRARHAHDAGNHLFSQNLVRAAYYRALANSGNRIDDFDQLRRIDVHTSLDDYLLAAPHEAKLPVLPKVSQIAGMDESAPEHLGARFSVTPIRLRPERCLRDDLAYLTVLGVRPVDSDDPNQDTRHHRAHYTVPAFHRRGNTSAGLRHPVLNCDTQRLSDLTARDELLQTGQQRSRHMRPANVDRAKRGAVETAARAARHHLLRHGWKERHLLHAIFLDGGKCPLGLELRQHNVPIVRQDAQRDQSRRESRRWDTHQHGRRGLPLR